VLTIAAMGVGTLIAGRIRSSSGLDVAAAGPEVLRSIRPYLIAAEWLKIGLAAATAGAVFSAFRFLSRSKAPLILGLLSAALLLAAGVLGLSAVASLSGPSGSPTLGRVTGLSGLLSMALMALWAALLPLDCRLAVEAPRWLRICGVLLATMGLISLFTPFALVFGLLAIAWWTGLGRLFQSR
jgi:hypothetical protein